MVNDCFRNHPRPEKFAGCRVDTALLAAPGVPELDGNPLVSLNFAVWHTPCRGWPGPRLGRAAGPADDGAAGRARPSSRTGSSPMQNTSLIALSRQIALARQLDVVANN